MTPAVLVVVEIGNGATVINATVGAGKALAGAIGEVSSRLELDLLLTTCIEHLVGGGVLLVQASLWLAWWSGCGGCSRGGRHRRRSSRGPRFPPT